MTKKHAVRERKRNQQQESDRQRFYRVMTGLDLLKFLDTEKWLKKHMLEFPYRDAVITVDPGLEEPVRPLIQNYLTSTFRGLELQEIIRYGLPFLLTAEVNETGKETMKACTRVKDEFQDAEIAAFQNMYSRALMQSSFTTGFVSVDRTCGRNLNLEVKRLLPEVAKVKFHAGWREIFRVFGFDRGNGHLPCPLTAQAPGRSDRLPLYLQGHAIRRLYERLDVGGLQPMLPALVANCMSSQEPILYQGRYLVPVDLPSGCRLGYVVVTVAEPGLVGVTFLFLTMDGTPEGDKLHRRLRFRREDAEYNGLDHLSTFVESDLSVNDRVRELVGDLGGLMDFAAGMRELDQRTEKAVSLLSYLGVK